MSPKKKEEPKDPKKDPKKDAKAESKPAPAEVKKKAKAPKEEPVRLPILAEVVLNFSGLFLVLMALMIAGVSYVSGARLMDIALRTGVTILVMGILLVSLSKMISGGVVKALLQPEEPKEENKPAPAADMSDLFGSGLDA